MDIEIIYSIVGIVIFIAIIIFTLKSDVTTQVQSKEEKQYEIINQYKKELREALEPLKNDQKARMAKKSQLLMKFSDELSLNIFFDQSEIREIVADLSRDI